MRVQQGAVNLTECSFDNNTARLLGGAVFVDREGHLSTDDVTLSNSISDDHALEGDLMYSIGNVRVRQTRLYVRSASNHVSILCHSGARWSIETVSIEVRCPVGYRLRTTNASIYGVLDEGLVRSYKMDQLSYFCESCPRNKYSLDAGFLNYRFVATLPIIFMRAVVRHISTESFR
jgi:predicted outer membrane repeat protein